FITTSLCSIVIDSWKRMPTSLPTQDHTEGRDGERDIHSSRIAPVEKAYHLCMYVMIGFL
ncbi:MAG: hypothetical protein JXO48_12555, partial [Deltaproteobacteria bacterium]|nr:hypothetical protein [Deltaproteobacteria bacterium]